MTGKELDFDELDKAVNNLMGGVHVEGSDIQKQKTLDLGGSTADDKKPVYKKLDEVANKIDEETHVAPEERVNVEELDNTLSSEIKKPESKFVSAPRPAKGRFMDMVHPSADMRSSVPTSRLVVPSRSGNSDASTGKDMEPDLPESEGETAPLTPFLPNAKEKVEKRPLGAVVSPFSDVSGESTEKTESPVKPENIFNEKENSTPEVIETEPINSEFKKEDIKNEKGQDQRPINATDIIAEPTEEDRALQAIESQEVEEPESHSEQEPTDGPVRAVESGDTERLSSGSKTPPPIQDDNDQKSAAIYDTREYHQPLNHPAAQKSGVWKIFVVIGIVLLCAALGAAAYFIAGIGVG